MKLDRLLIIFQTDLILWLRQRVQWTGIVPKLPNSNFSDYPEPAFPPWIRIEKSQDLSTASRRGVLAVLQKAQMSSIGPRNRIFRIGVKSGSSNQREEARWFSQVNAGLLFPRIRNRWPRIENRGSRKRLRNNVLDLCNSREKAEGQRRSCKQGTFDSSNKGVMADMDTFVT